LALQKDNFRRLLRTVEALSDLGPEMTAEREFPYTARAMLSACLEAGGAREGALFTYSDKPSLFTSIAAEGFTLMPEPAVIPLLPRHVHALISSHEPVILDPGCYDLYLSANGNVAPELFKCIVPLKVASKLVGLIALGRREGDSLYDSGDLEALDLLCHYVALAVHNHSLTQTLAQRVSENLRLMASLHGFYDNALEAFATAIDVKHINIHGHSLRVGGYASAIGEAMNMDPGEIAALRSAGYLHDIGKVAVDKRLFGKPSSLDAEEFRDCQRRPVSVAPNSGNRALASRAQRRFRLSRWAAARRCAHASAHRRPGRYLRRHDQRASLPGTDFPGQHIE
jgi:hypothetical protein